MMELCAVVAAAGGGERLGAPVPKAFVELPGGTLLEHSLRSLARQGVTFAAVAVPVGFEPPRPVASPPGMEAALVEGGPRRQDSVLNAARLLPPARVVLVHDAARPFLRPGLVAELAAEALRRGAAVPTLPCPDTLKLVEGGVAVRTVDRSGVHLVQTPQAFRRDVFEAMLPLYDRLEVTDDAAIAEAAGFPPRAVEGSPFTFKVTRPADLELARILAARSAP